MIAHSAGDDCLEFRRRFGSAEAAPEDNRRAESHDDPNAEKYPENRLPKSHCAAHLRWEFSTILEPFSYHWPYGRASKYWFSRGKPVSRSSRRHTYRRTALNGALCSGEREVGEFGGAVEAEGKADGADAAVDVKLQVFELEETLDILLAHGWEDQRANVGEADLAAVGVAGEHEVDEREARVQNDLVDIIGLVAHEEDRRIGSGGDGEVEIGPAGSGVVGAAEPDDVLAAFEGGIAVDEDGRSVGFQGTHYMLGTDVDVVVAEDAEALRGLEGGEDLCANTSGPPGNGERGGTAADEVSCDENKVGIEVVDLGDHTFKERGLGVLLEMDVAHLDDAEALERVGEVADGEVEAGDFELVARVGSSVGGQTEAS
jgi:hypothetical protein